MWDIRRHGISRKNLERREGTAQLAYAVSINRSITNDGYLSFEEICFRSRIGVGWNRARIVSRMGVDTQTEGV